MKAFIATAIASLLCLCTFRVPLVAQVARNPNAIDVHLHAMHPENFSVPASANFGAVRKTFGTNERDPCRFRKIWHSSFRKFWHARR
jgi:hypothetical protein